MPSARAVLERIDPASGREADGDAPRRLLWALGTGAFGLAFSLTVVAAYLPPVLREFTDSRTLIGVILGAEGGFAIALPLVVGPLSDRFWSDRLGRRRAFMVAALPFLGASLAFVALAPSLLSAALVLAVFFLAYYLYEPPYRSLYPDRLDRDVQGRAHGVQHVLRGIALGAGLVLGGVLFGLWRPLPFLLAAAVVVATTWAVVRLVDEHRRRREGDGEVRESLREPYAIVREAPLVRRFLVANTAWELTFAGMRTFVVLYVIEGLDQPVFVSTAILAAVAGGYTLAAVGAGRIGDAIGIGRVVLACSFVYGGGLLLGGLASTWRWLYLVPVFLVAIAAGAIMTLAWGLLFRLMPEEHRGSTTGLATVTKGLGLLLGPLLVGVAIDLADGTAWFEGTDGYAVMWPVVGVPILAAIPFVVGLMRAEDARREG